MSIILIAVSVSTMLIMQSCVASGIISSSDAAETRTAPAAASATNAVQRYEKGETAKTSRLEITLDNVESVAGTVSDDVVGSTVLELEMTVKNISGEPLEITQGMFHIASDGSETPREEITVKDEKLAERRLMNKTIDAGASKTGLLFFAMPESESAVLSVCPKADGVADVQFEINVK